MTKRKEFKNLMCMNPYQYHVDEINQAFKTLSRGYHSFNLCGRSVVYVYGKFSFADCNGIGNLELWYIDPMIDETVAQCVTFQAVDASRCTVMYNSKKPGHVKAMIVSNRTGKSNVCIRFTYVNDCDEDLITHTVKKTLMDTRVLVDSDHHFSRSLSLINNMMPLEFFTTHLGFMFDHTTIDGNVYKMVPKLKFDHNNYSDQVSFIIGFVKLDADYNHSSFVMTEKVFRNHGDYEISTGYIDKSHLENIIVSPNGITITVNDKQVLKIDYSKSKEDTKRRITKDEVKNCTEFLHHRDYATDVNTSNNECTGIVKITTLKIAKYIGPNPLLRRHEEAFVNVTHCELNEDMMLRINALVFDSARSYIFDFSKCVLVKIYENDSGFKSIFVDFNEKKIYEVTYTE